MTGGRQGDVDFVVAQLLPAAGDHVGGALHVAQQPRVRLLIATPLRFLLGPGLEIKKNLIYRPILTIHHIL